MLDERIDQDLFARVDRAIEKSRSLYRLRRRTSTKSAGLRASDSQSRRSVRAGGRLARSRPMACVFCPNVNAKKRS